MVKINCCVLTNIPKECGLKYKNWHDGFVKTIKILNNDYNYNISIINVIDGEDIDFEKYECIIIKSNKLVEQLLQGKYNNWLNISSIKYSKTLHFFFIFQTKLNS